MALHFSRVDTPDNLEIWSASSGGSGPGLRGQPGSLPRGVPPIGTSLLFRVGGSPFNTFAEAEQACATFLRPFAG
jgi:hypothetical protein